MPESITQPGPSILADLGIILGKSEISHTNLDPCLFTIHSDFVTGLASENEKRNSGAHAQRREMEAAASAGSAASGEASAAAREGGGGRGRLLVASGVVLGDVYRPPKRLQVG